MKFFYYFIWNYLIELRSSDTTLPEMEADVLNSIIQFRDGVKSQNLIGKKFIFDSKLAEDFLK